VTSLSIYVIVPLISSPSSFYALLPRPPSLPLYLSLVDSLYLVSADQSSVSFQLSYTNTKIYL
jgi:hypothetical protein